MVGGGGFQCSGGVGDGTTSTTAASAIVTGPNGGGGRIPLRILRRWIGVDRLLGVTAAGRERGDGDDEGGGEARSLHGVIVSLTVPGQSTQWLSEQVWYVGGSSPMQLTR